MSSKDIDVLKKNGWKLVSETPLSIQHSESNQVVEGFLAEMVLRMLNDGVVSFA